MKRAAKGRGTGEEGLPDRAWLVAAARQAFTDLGAEASMEQVARSAGVSTAALSREFADRDTLVAAVLDDLLTSLRKNGSPEAAGDPERLSRGSAASVRFPRLRLRHAVPLLAFTAALASLATPPTASAEVVAPPTGATVLTVSPLWPVVPLSGALGGSLCQTNSCESVRYMPFFTTGGTNALDRRLSGTTTLKSTDGTPTIVFGFSNGALVAQRWMTEHAGDPTAPSPDELSFVLIGNPRRAYGGSMPAIPETGYHVVDVVRQYDPLADFPDHPNLLALANIATGIFSPMHLDYTQVDLDDPNNVVWTEGNTTYVFVPTENLPLLAPLRMLGMNKLADELNAPLKAIVEKAYDRPYLSTSPPAADPTAAATVAESAVTVSSDTTSDRVRAKIRAAEQSVSATADAPTPAATAATTTAAEPSTSPADGQTDDVTVRGARSKSPGGGITGATSRTRSWPRLGGKHASTASGDDRSASASTTRATAPRHLRTGAAASATD
jgi:hypothetical protein